MNTLAVVFEQPEQLSVRSLELVPATDTDVIVQMHWSGISTGTEKLLFTGRMPPFPGLGYPLVPGYEGVGEIVQAGPESLREVGQLVYVPGSLSWASVVRCSLWPPPRITPSATIPPVVAN